LLILWWLFVLFRGDGEEKRYLGGAAIHYLQASHYLTRFNAVFEIKTDTESKLRLRLYRHKRASRRSKTKHRWFYSQQP
jgi:hypothetical protein